MVFKGRKKNIKIILCIIFIFFFLISKFFYQGRNENIVNVYDWYGNLSKEILDQFEKETGIKVRYDVYDSNEILEAKLLATNSGYDVVFPSASPYVSRQIQAEVYLKLEKKMLPNLKDLNPHITKYMKIIDPDLDYSIPYYWGTLGIVIDLDKVKKKIPQVQNMGYEIIFDPQNLSKLAKCGVSFLEEPVDVFPLVLSYLGKNRGSTNIEDLNLAFNHLLKLRPYIRKFTSSRFMNDLIVGDSCIVQAWSGEIQRMRELLKELNRNVIYIFPREGSTLWIDCIAIPKGAPHEKNAYTFINFLLRPDVSAKITNHSFLPTTVEESYQYVEPELRKDTSIFPPKETISNLHLDKPCTCCECETYDKKRMKLWAKVKLNRDKG